MPVEIVFYVVEHRASEFKRFSLFPHIALLVREHFPLSDLQCNALAERRRFLASDADAAQVAPVFAGFTGVHGHFSRSLKLRQPYADCKKYTDPYANANHCQF